MQWLFCFRSLAPMHLIAQSNQTPMNHNITIEAAGGACCTVTETTTEDDAMVVVIFVISSHRISTCIVLKLSTDTAHLFLLYCGTAHTEKWIYPNRTALPTQTFNYIALTSKTRFNQYQETAT